MLSVIEARRAAIVALHRELIPHAAPMPPPEHAWIDGWYVRYLTLKTGSLVVGKVHKHDHPLIVLTGRALIADGLGGTREVRAGYQGLSRAGTKRAVFCIEDTTFMTMHKNPSNTRDLAALEAEHIAPDDPETQALMAEHQQGVTHDMGSCRSDRGQHRAEPALGPPGSEGPETGADASTHR